MNVLHFSTFGDVGGAAIAARRLHEGLCRLGLESRFMTRADLSPGMTAAKRPGVVTAPSIETGLYPVYRQFRAAGVDTLFSADLPTWQLCDLPAVRQADILHLHWVAGLLSTPAIRSLQDLGKPIVWTLHDQAPFTGGCHYSAGCEAYRRDCDACPQLRAEASHVPGLFLAHKRAWLAPTSIDVVCPSEWLAKCARSSALFQASSVRTIANALPVGVYQGVAQDAARAALGLPANALIVLIGSDNLDERRKGHGHAIDALSNLASHAALGERARRGDVMCVAFGEGELVLADIPVVRLGRLAGDAQLALAYRASDLFLLPSLEDNLPNTLLEATAAGTPVVAYATGGIPDIVERAGCGLLVPRGDVAALGSALALLADDPAARRRMGLNGQTYAATHLDLPVQATAYLEVYRQVLESHATAGRAVAATTPPHSMYSAVAESEAALFEHVLAPAELSRGVAETLARDNATQQDVIAARGGEIVDLRRVVAGLRHEVARIEDEWRVTRETLHQASTDLRHASEALVHERRTSETARAVLSAERAALTRKLRTQMTDVVVMGTGDTGRRLWEALTRSGAAHVVAFVHPRPPQSAHVLLGLGVHGLDWLAHGSWDVIVVPDEPSDASVELVQAGIDPSRIVVLPIDVTDEALGEIVAERFPDPIAPWLATAPPRDAVRVGIFGTGSAAMKVWEAVAEIDEAEAVWFADNDRRRQGTTHLWLDVIAPSEMASRGFDAIVVGSMSRDAIRQQLVALGVASTAIVTPDVSCGPQQIRTELAAWLHRRQTQEVTQ